MGKNNKNRQQRELTPKQLEKKEAAKAQAKKQKRRKGLTVTALCCAGVIVIGAVGFTVARLIKKDGAAQRRRTAMETDHYYVTNSMLGFFFDKTYQSYKSANEGVEGAELPDENKSFRKQQFSSDQTWYDYLMSASVYGLENTLKSCEAAYAAGYELSDELKAKCKADAEAYQSDTLAEGINTEDIRKVLELIEISSNYHKDAIAAVNVTDEEVKQYAEENINHFRRLKFLCYTLAWADATTAVNEDPSVVQLQYADAKAENDKITASKTPEEFKENVRNFLINVKNKDEESADNIVNAMQMNTVASDFEPDLVQWVLDGAGINQIYTFMDTDEKSFKNYMLLDEMIQDESETIDMRVICLGSNSYDSEDDAKAEAQKVLDDWKNNGSKVEDFADYARNHSDDFMTYSDGGLVEGYSANTKTYGDDLHDWAFDKSRKEGDTGIFKTSNAIVIAYYLAPNKYNALEAAAYKELKAAKTSAVDKAKDNYSVMEYEDVYNLIEY